MILEILNQKPIIKETEKLSKKKLFGLREELEIKRIN